MTVVHVREVGPRDGFQNEPEHIPTGQKIRLINALARAGFTRIERISVPFAWEFADPAAFARALASTGPGFEAIQNVGEAAFLDAATRTAGAHQRAGLPLRAELPVVGYLARKASTR